MDIKCASENKGCNQHVPIIADNTGSIIPPMTPKNTLKKITKQTSNANINTEQRTKRARVPFHTWPKTYVCTPCKGKVVFHKRTSKRSI